MFTLYRPAYYDNPRAAFLAGSSQDVKKIKKKNGASLLVIDEGQIYRFDEENKKWYKGVAT